MNPRPLVVAIALTLAARVLSQAGDGNGQGTSPSCTPTDISPQCGQTQTPPSTETFRLWYDTLYDQQGASISSVACSNGNYGLGSAGYSTFGDLPTFPFIGGAPQVQSWDSANCGTCWELTYINEEGIITSLSFTAINTPPQPQGGFSISSQGINRLTGHVMDTDGASITVAQLSASACGL